MKSMIINAIINWFLKGLADLASSWIGNKVDESTNKKVVDDLKKSESVEDRQDANSRAANRIGRK